MLVKWALAAYLTFGLENVDFWGVRTPLSWFIS